MRGQGVHGAPNGALDPGTLPLPPLRRLSCRQEPRRRSPETEPISARCQTWELEAREGHLLLGRGPPLGGRVRDGRGRGEKEARTSGPPPVCGGPAAGEAGGPRCANARLPIPRGKSVRADWRIDQNTGIGNRLNRFRRFSERREPGLGLSRWDTNRLRIRKHDDRYAVAAAELASASTWPDARLLMLAASHRPGRVQVHSRERDGGTGARTTVRR